MTGLTIPGSVTSIGSSPFANCTILTDITFLGLNPPATDPSWLTDANLDLRGHAYFGATFPAPGGSFNGLTMGDNIPEDYNYMIRDGQATITRYHGFSKDVSIPATLGGCPVVAIGYRAFWRLPITSVTIPDGVVSIGDYAFAGCPLTGVIIPGSVASIGESAFASCTSYQPFDPRQCCQHRRKRV